MYSLSDLLVRYSLMFQNFFLQTFLKVMMALHMLRYTLAEVHTPSGAVVYYFIG